MNFEFNEIGVCQNPEVETIFDNKKHIVRIKLAESDGKWLYGYSFSYDNNTGGGGIAPCFSEYRKHYETRTEAREEALNQMLTVYTKDKYSEVRKVIMSKFETQGSLF